jgi:hypothetical protein
LNHGLLLADVYCSWQSQQGPSAVPDGLPVYALPGFGAAYLAEKGGCGHDNRVAPCAERPGKPPQCGNRCSVPRPLLRR